MRPRDLGVEAFFPKPFDLDKLLWHIKDLLAIPSQVHATAARDRQGAEMGGVADDLVAVMSTLLICAEQFANAPGLSDDLRTVAVTGLDAAQRASVLARRLNHLIHAPT